MPIGPIEIVLLIAIIVGHVFVVRRFASKWW